MVHWAANVQRPDRNPLTRLVEIKVDVKKQSQGRAKKIWNLRLVYISPWACAVSSDRCSHCKVHGTSSRPECAGEAQALISKERRRPDCFRIKRSLKESRSKNASVPED